MRMTTDSDNEESEDEDDDDEGLDDDPTIEHLNVAHHGAVNRIRSMPQNPGFLATMADTGKAHIFDLTASLNSMMSKGPRSHNPNAKPVYTYSGHQEEGYAIDWNPVVAGRMATGDMAGKIRLWNPAGTSWQVDATPFSGHTGSVEDIQWSPTEATVFSSASSDRSVRIWDIRDNSKAQIQVDAHSEDVNVISWNRNVSYLLASGCDDGSFKVRLLCDAFVWCVDSICMSLFSHLRVCIPSTTHYSDCFSNYTMFYIYYFLSTCVVAAPFPPLQVWDLRSIRKGCTPLAHFTYHKAPVTSIEWAPHDESVIALCSADNQLTVWDLSVEADDLTSANAAAASEADPALAEYPPQLLFIHQGQFNMKELHFHPQIPGTLGSTAENGFNVFKPAISVSS
jgi:ribosome assembly protein RRB1